MVWYQADLNEFKSNREKRRINRRPIGKIKTYFNKIKIQGLMMSLELEKHPKASLEGFLKEAKRLTEHLIVWVKCPKCGLDVPQIDMTKHGYCYYCYVREREK